MPATPEELGHNIDPHLFREVTDQCLQLVNNPDGYDLPLNTASLAIQNASSDRIPRESSIGRGRNLYESDGRVHTATFIEVPGEAGIRSMITLFASDYTHRDPGSLTGTITFLATSPEIHHAKMDFQHSRPAVDPDIHKRLTSVSRRMGIDAGGKFPPPDRTEANMGLRQRYLRNPEVTRIRDTLRSLG